jgi:glycerophosphoryl diester phosphodiesterase
MKTIRFRDLLAAGRDFRRTWPQLVLSDLLARTVAIVVTTPVVGLLLKLFLLTADDGVLSDTDIATFVLHPIGMVAVVVVGSVSLGMLFVEQSFLMVIGFGAAEERRVTWLDAGRYTLRYSRELVRMAGEFLVRVLAIAAPFLGGIGGVYLLFLRKYDINFYLTDKPPEFWTAVVLAGLLVGILGIILLRKFAGWILALPLILFEATRGRLALRSSGKATAGAEWKIALAISLWLAGNLVLSTVVTYLIGLIGGVLVPGFGANTALMVTGLAVTLLIAAVSNLTVSIIATVLFPLLLVRLYRAVAGPGRLQPAIAAPGTLGARVSLSIPGKTILWAVAAALVVIVGGAYVATRSISQEDNVAIIAHRGASGAAPENTIAAFERAIADGADWIELDVQENADGTVVVAHDSDFMKTARVNLKVWNATDDDLRDIDIGSWFGPEFAGERPPTLRQALELARGELGVVIELKYYGHDHQLEPRVVDIVEETGMVSDVMVMSLKLPGLQKAAALRPDWTYGLLNTASVGDLTRLNLAFLALNASAASRGMIRRAHSRGMKLYVWTVNDPVQMSVMMSRGVDGLITDEPALARRVIEAREALSPIGRLVIWIAGETGFLRGTDESSTAEDA